MKENKLLTIDKLLAKELIVFNCLCLSKKMVKTQLHLKMFLLKTNLNTIPETSISLFQRNILAQYVSKLFHTVVPLIGIAFPLT